MPNYFAHRSRWYKYCLPTLSQRLISSSGGVKVSIRSSNTNKSAKRSPNDRLEKISKPMYQDTYFRGGNDIISIRVDSGLRSPGPEDDVSTLSLRTMTRCDCVSWEQIRQGNIVRKLKFLHTAGNRSRIPAERYNFTSPSRRTRRTELPYLFTSVVESYTSKREVDLNNHAGQSSNPPQI